MKSSSVTLSDRALAAWLGLACGDALGATVEFMTPSEIKAKYGQHREMIGGGWLRLAPGQTTDDTAMALALAEAISESGGWNPAIAADHFVRWFKSRPVDIGNTCRRGIQRYMTQGTLFATPSDGDGGNGAAMRLLPVAIFTIENEELFHRATLEQAHITHHHPLSDAACIALGRMVQALLLGGGVEQCREIADQLVSRHRQFRYSPYPGRASGYIVDTVQTVLHYFFNGSSFEECIVNTVNQGDDADTSGAIIGMLAGARFGLSAIPARWLSKLDAGVVKRIERQVSVASCQLSEREKRGVKTDHCRVP